jgi:hypothetical protein
MSFPSISEVIREQNIDLQVASDEVLDGAIFEALHRNLHAGFHYLEDMADDLLLGHEKRILKIEDPNSMLGKQIIRLLGGDVARGICEQRFGVAFGLYNCCAPVVARTREELNMSPREQIELQNGVLASADC